MIVRKVGLKGGVLCMGIVMSLACKDIGKLMKIKKPDPNSDRIIISLEVKAGKADAFEIYYHEKGESFSAENRVVQHIEGGNEFEKLNFALEPLVFPSNIRIDFGNQKNQTPIQIRNLEFHYNEGTHRFTEEEIRKFFRPNNSLKFDFSTMTGKGMVHGSKYDPYLVSYNISMFVNKLILY